MALSGVSERSEETESKGTGVMSAWFYILRLRSGAYYCGSTKNLMQRWNEHQNGRACRTTMTDPECELLYYELLAEFDLARKRELQVKKWSRAKKEALIADNRTRLKKLAKSREKPKC